MDGVKRNMISKDLIEAAENRAKFFRDEDIYCIVEKSHKNNKTRVLLQLNCSMTLRESQDLVAPWKRVNKRNLHKGNEDENCHCQRSI